MQSSLVLRLAVVGSVVLAASSSAAATTQVPAEHPVPSQGSTSPANPPAPTPTDASSPAAGTASGTATPPATVLAEDDDKMESTFHSSRKENMQEFAEGSMQELRVGAAKARYALNLFGDLSLGASSRSEGNARAAPAFAVGVFDMLFNADLDGKILATSEITFQYEPNAPLAELERLHLRWKPAKAFFIEVGRFHTDIGYWNVAYHHGKWLQLSIERPRAILLHGGLLPVHWIGAQTGVNIPIGSANLAVVGSIGSARDPLAGLNTSHNAHGTSSTPINAGHAKIELSGLLHNDFRIGASGIYSRIRGEDQSTRPALPTGQAINEYIGNAYIAFPSVPFTFIAEGYIIQHTSDVSQDIKGAKWRTYAAFAMMGYQIGRVTPYIRGEYIKSKKNVDLTDPFYVPQPRSGKDPDVTLDLVEGTVGARIDTSTWSALKLEYRVTGGVGARLEYDQLNQKLSTPVIHTVVANWSFGI